MNVRSISLLVLSLSLVLATGCHQDMYDQAKKEPLEASEFFKDGRVARPLVPGTIARGHLETETAMFTGKEGGQLVADLPMPVSEQLLKQGQTQFNIYCTPCHGRIGDGDGMIVSRGFKRPPSYHIERLRGAPVGHYFDVITNGFGSMPAFKNRIAPEDRWAIIAYVRALQLSQFAPASTLSETELNALNAPAREERRLMLLATETVMPYVLAFADTAHAADHSTASVLLRGYLIAWLFWLGISLGSLALSWLHNLTGGKWGRAIRLELTAAGQVLPLLAIGVIPLLMNIPALFEWARPEVVEHDLLLQKKTVWLNPTFLVIRTVFYFAVWIGLGTWITRLRRRAQINPTFETEHALRFFSAMAIVGYGLLVTLLSVDYSMSLEPHWYSGIYGVIYMVSYGLAALGFAVAVASTRSPEKDPAPFAKRDLGNLMLAFTMLWTYMNLSQFLIIWMGDLPEENVWYLHREHGGWMWLALVLIFLGFAAPFMTLLSTAVKENRKFLGFVAFWVVILRWLDVVWNVEPAFSNFDAAALTSHAVVAAAVGAVWMIVFFWRRSALKNEFPYEPAVAEGHH